MGFKAQALPKSPPMLLIASLPLDADAVGAAVKAGADALLLTLNQGKENKAFAQIAKAAGPVPWGASLETPTPDYLKRLQEKGCDFLVFGVAKTPAAVLQHEEMGRILRVEPALPDGTMRTLDRLSLDALLLASEEENYLTVNRLLACQRLADLTRKPLLVVAPSVLTLEEIRALGQIGVDGVVVESSEPEKLAQWRKNIDSLPPRAKGERGRRDVMLPLAPLPEKGITEEEEEEEV